MTEVLLVSHVLLWFGLAACAVLLLGLARQVGVLHQRSAPLGAMMVDKGPDIGDTAPVFNVQDFFKRPIQVGGPIAGKGSLLMFVSPTCPICNTLLPTVRSVARGERLNVVLISDGDRQDHERFLKEHPLGSIPYVVSSTIGMHFQIGRIPYAVLLDHEGKIVAKGLVNTREHLESLLEVGRLGYASLQEFMKGSIAAKPANGAAGLAAGAAPQ